MRLALICVLLIVQSSIARADEESQRNLDDIARPVGRQPDSFTPKTINGAFQLNATTTATADPPSFMSQTAATDGAPRPRWIPAHAFTNDDMIAYYGLTVFGRNITWRLPNEPTTAKLSKSVSMWWNGYCPDKCKISVEPDWSVPAGNFKFHTIGAPDGPHGWLEATGIKDKIGWQYRYWFDQPK
jgi:hypothetical protein